MIGVLTGSNLGVPKDENHLLSEWRGHGKRVVFSYAQMGKAMSAHFAAEPDSLRYLKESIEEFCEWVFFAFPWCRMILAFTGPKSIGRLCKKCGFEMLLSVDEAEIYVRYRDELYR